MNPNQQNQAQPQPQHQQAQSSQQSGRHYDEETTTIASFGFTANNLVSISLVRRMPFNPDPKERYFSFLSFVPGVGQPGNRTYDFKQRITQKIALRDMDMLAFVLEQASTGNLSVLPYKSFTNSGNGSKCLYLQANEKGEGFVFGLSQNKTYINLLLSAPQAHSIGQTVRILYQKGMDLEIDFQLNERNRATSGQLRSQAQGAYQEENEYNSWESGTYDQ